MKIEFLVVGLFVCVLCAELKNKLLQKLQIWYSIFVLHVDATWKLFMKFGQKLSVQGHRKEF